jgi:DNA-binding CsgD family transcriptional regulator
MPVLGSKLLLLIFTSIQILVFFSQFINYLSSKQEHSRLRFMLLIIGFIIFNLLNLLGPNILGIGILASKIISYTFGVLFAIGYLLYIFKDINVLERTNDTRSLIWIFSISLGLGYITASVFIGNSIIARNILVFLPTGGSIVFCVYMQFQFRKKIEWSKSSIHSKFMSYSSYIGLVLLTSIPLFIYIGEYDLNLSLLNITFICSITFYIQKLLTENKKELQLSDEKCGGSNENLLTNYQFTRKEKELVNLILTDLTFVEIGKIVHLSGGTCSRHATNIYRKTGCQSRAEFREKFLNQEIESQ